MEKEQLYEYAGRLRRELHALVDQHMDDFVKRIGDGNLSSKTVMACSLAGPDYFFKGKKPVSVVLPGGEERPCKTWREAVSMILKDCNADAKMHGRLLAISGKVAGISAPVPPELGNWVLLGTVGGISVCAVQLLLSLIIRAFAPPVAIGLIGGIGGLMLTAYGYGYAFPYSLLCIGMRANNPAMVLDLAPFLLSVFLYTALCTVLSIRVLSHRDVTAE